MKDSQRDILTAKLLPPRLDNRIIDRPRLRDTPFIADPEPSVILFIAPAGFGKTVAMLQYCQAVQKPFVWYQLDANDNDPVVFLNHLIAALRKVFPGFGKKLLSQLKQTDFAQRQRQIIAGLFDELTAQSKHPIVLALDDVHSLTESAIHSFLEEFLSYLPHQLQVCLASRVPLPFSLFRFSAAGQVMTIDHQTMRFTKDEIRSFFKPGKAQESLIETIEKETEGWPLAVRLIKQAISDPSHPVSFNKKDLFDYLTVEILQQQTEEIQQFLLFTSVLEVLTPDYCNQLLDRTDSAKVLDYLDKHQLFLTPLAQPGAFQYHQLFREFLLSRLKNQDKSYFHKAGVMATQMGNPAKAIEYFITAEALQEAIPLIMETGLQTLRQGSWQTVQKWLAQLAPEQIIQQPWLILFQAEVELYKGSLIEAEHLLEKARKSFEQKNDWNGLSETLIQQARVLRSRGRYSESIELLDQVLSGLLPEEFHKRFDFPLEKSLALVLAGQFAESERVLTEALSAAETENNGYLIANFSEALSNLHFLKGDYSKAMAAYQRAVRVSPEPVLTSYYMRDSIALIYRDWGDLDRAYEHAMRSVTVKEKLGLVEVLPYAYYQLASLQFDQGDLTVAEESYRRSIAIAKETGGEQVFCILSLLMLAKLLVIKNQFVESESLIQEAFQLAKSQSPYVLAFTKEMAAQVLLETGRAPEAIQMLFEAVGVLEQTGAKYPLCIAYGAIAKFFSIKGEIQPANQYAIKCLALAARENYLQIFLSAYGMLQPVLKAGLETGVETLFIQRVLVGLGEKSLDLLANLVASPDPKVRCRVIFPLAEIGGTQARKIFRSLINDPDSEVREFAEHLSPQLGMARVHPSSILAVPVIRLETLGNLKIHINGEESNRADWTTAKARDLLAYLAHCGEPISRSRVLEDLWPNTKVSKSLPLFHTTLYYLRKTLNHACQRKDLIIYEEGKYRLLKESFITDHAQFERMLNSAKKANASPETAISYLIDAIDLYRGDYLADMDYPWLILIREQIESHYCQALKKISLYYLEKQEYLPAINYLRLLIGNDPFAEEVSGLLMQAYSKTGNVRMVRETYQSLTTLLQKELGIKPSAKTIELFRQLTSGSR